MLLDVGFLCLFALSACGLGLALLRGLDCRPEASSDRLALALPLGMGFQALIVLGLGELGLLSAPMLGGLLVGSMACWGLVGRGEFRWPARPRLSRERIWDLLLGAVLVGTFLTALLPVTDGDALCYHLQVPKIFLAQGSVSFDPDLHETVYPLVTEMLYAIALALRGPVACRLVEWLLGVVLALNVAAMARPFLGGRASWAACIVLLAPAISNGMSAPLNDVALAAFANAALHAWLRADERPSIRSAGLAGILMGFAIGVKYPALVLFGLLGVISLLRCLMRGRSRESWRALVAFGLMTLLIGGGWYLRAFQATGNPVHPFFRHVFGGAGLDEVLDPIKRPMPVSTWNLLTAMVPLTLQPERFDSFSHQFGPLFLLFLPALVFERPSRRLVLVVFVGFTFLTLCLTQRQSMRFVLSALGPLSVGVAWQASRWWERRDLGARALVVLMLLSLGFEAGIAVARPRSGASLLLGRESEENYLARREPTYVVGTWMSENLPEDARVIGQDHRGYYLPRPYTMELAHRRRTGLGSDGASAEAVIETLRASGYSHLMLCPPVPENAVEFDPTLGHLLAPWLASRPSIYRRDLTDADGVTRRYAIYELADPLAKRDPEGVRR